MKNRITFSGLLSLVLKRFIYGMLYLMSLLPLSTLYSVTNVLYFIGWKIIGYRKGVVLQNLARSFPQKSYQEIDDLAKSYSSYLFSMFAEWIKSLSENEELRLQRITFENKELLDVEENVFLLMGHYGNWESLNMLPFVTERRIYGIYQEQHSSASDYFCRKMRKRFGDKTEVLESKQAVRFILQNKTPAVYLFIADQAPPIQSKMKLTFLNQPTFVFDGVERLAIKTNARVLYTEIEPRGDGFYNISFSKIELKTGITKEFFNRLEKTICRVPQYWLWSHRRWKHEV